MSATTLPSRRARITFAELDRSRLALLALLALTAIAYIWNLTDSGYANSFYAAAVQAGTKSWKAFFFGSLDSSSFITVDKPPAALWVMALSGRIFGFSSASMLIPNVLEGVLAVGLLHGAVKRWYGAAAGLVAGGVLAVTPVAALMFRFNNPDALLVCLLVASAYCLVRALERGSTRWLVAVGTLLGFAFLTKMLQAFLVLPGFALVYAVAAPVSVRRRAAQLAAGGLALLLSCGWWLAAVALWPTGSRPMIDGSPDNNIFNLIFGYNGLGRIFGSSGPSGGAGGGGGGGGNFSGATGPLRLFNDLMGGQAAWLLPASVLALGAGLWWTRPAPRTDRARAGLLLWGSWLFVTAAVFSFSSGVIHTYYTVALAPAIAALVGIGVVMGWRRRTELVARALLAAGVAISAAWAIVLLRRTPSWEPWLIPVIAVTGVAAMAVLLVPGALNRAGAKHAAAIAAAIACLAGPFAFTAQTLGAAHTGSIPTAGPSSSGSFGGGAPGGGGFGGRSTGGAAPTGAGAPVGGGTAGGGAGGGSTSTALVKALETGASSYRWVAATDGSQEAATLELSSNGAPVMAIGGFNGEGGRLTLAQFKKYVNAGEIHYYIVSGGGGGGFGGVRGGFTGNSTKQAVASLFGGSSSGDGPPSGGGAPGSPVVAASPAADPVAATPTAQSQSGSSPTSRRKRSAAAPSTT
jgi:4-amino-4-deoxy-L-arabinose transferase-like glycosyltransferase